jgi:hypothetical protein
MAATSFSLKSKFFRTNLILTSCAERIKKKYRENSSRLFP